MCYKMGGCFMKKVTFLCCLFCGLITQAIGATYNCKPQYIGDLAFKRSNEYLFVGESNYDDRLALVCGHKGTDGCKHGTVVSVYGKRVHKNKNREFTGYAFYRCNTKGGSSWHWLGDGDINKCSGQDGVYISSYWDDGFEIYGVGFGERVKYEDGHYMLWDEVCLVEEKKADTTKASETTSGQGAKQNQSAKNQSGDAGKNAKREWLAPCSQEDLLKVPHAKAGRYIFKNEKEGIVCAATECKDGYYLVRNAEGKSQGWCSYGTDPYATTNASETKSGQGASSSGTSAQNQSCGGTSGQGTSSSDASGAGATGADATGTGTSAQTKSGGGTSGQVLPTASVEEKSPCELDNPGWRWFEGRCITDTQYQNILAERQAAKVRVLTQEIESAASQLDSISSKFKVSVWKDAEGKFNTARLASDSIAGVVLGTAGGLITSHVVKKNQVENGFQDIKCTIGGQSVANWGDEFSVGIQ